MIPDPDAAKRTLRTLLRGTRTHAEAARVALIGRLLALDLPAWAGVAGVVPLPGEPDLMPAWDALHARGHPISMPETTLPGQPLLFRRWHPDAVLVAGRHDTRNPDGPPADPEFMFVPLLAWDRQMGRLGRGGGYYDRTLAARPEALAIGFGFAAQEVAAVPMGPYDVPLDAVLTEHGLVGREGHGVADLVPGRHRRP